MKNTTFANDIDEFVLYMTQDEDLFNIRYLEKVFPNLNVDDLEDIIERTKIMSGKQLDNIANINGETLLNICCMQTEIPV